MKNLGYSQNFLVNKKLVERLISKSNIDVTDYVIEIGPEKESPFGDISKNDLIELADGQTVLIKGNRQEII